MEKTIAGGYQTLKLVKILSFASFPAMQKATQSVPDMSNRI
jgi:hypothetical protein